MQAKEPNHREPFLPDLCRLPIVLALVLISELLIIVFVLASSPLSAFDWQRFSLLSLYALWVTLLSIAGLCLARHTLNKQTVTFAACISFAWVMLVLLLANTFSQWIYHVGDWRQWQWRWLVRDGFICAVLAGIGLRYLYMHQRWKNQNAAVLKAQFTALQARIKPHFLFNSMNTIASLIYDEPRAAEKAVEDLSVLFRMSLTHSDGKQLIDWREEVAICEAYLRIEQQRLGERLQVHWHMNKEDIDKQLPGFVLPALTIQPLIENAIYHGIETLAQGGELHISIDSSASGLLIAVSNPIDMPAGQTPTSVSDLNADSAGHGMALDNIRRRLSVLYADEARLGLNFAPDLSKPECKVEVFIPARATQHWS